MRTIERLQITLWRQACRHTSLAASLPEMARQIQAKVGFQSMHVFGLGADQCLRLASTVEDASPFQMDGPGVDSVRRFAIRGGLALLRIGNAKRSLLGPLASALGGNAVCGALLRDGTPEGVAAWVVPPDFELTEQVSTILASTLEPLAAAVEMARYDNELQGHRRSAEADRVAALRRLGREKLEEPIVGESGGLKLVLDRVSLIARSDVPALILGETGSGKEVVARAIHDRSRRHDGPFIRVNCGAIPPELIDSQLFGHERGAFTGATDQRQGWFERADGGTLFLDEVGELTPAAQVRLLRVLQDGTLERVGGQSPVRVDCRIIAATHRDLADMVRNREFREDLWYRLAVFPVVIPPLRERLDDLPALATHFAHRASVRFGLPDFELDLADIEWLRNYAWPGNIRELAAVIDRAALLGSHGKLAIAQAMGVIAPAQRRNAAAVADPPRSVPGPLDEAIAAHIRQALHQAGGKVEGRGGAAELLVINPYTLRSKMRKLGIDWKAYRNG